jgi:HPt (histidine-containing phosphotransfer) domain-containing protein
LASEDKLVDRKTISDLLYGDEEYIQEFSDATIESYTEFLDKYRKHVLDENLKGLRDAGHKIKPVSQMLNLSMILEEYEHAKKLLNDSDTEEQELESTVNRMENYVERIIDDLNDI